MKFKLTINSINIQIEAGKAPEITIGDIALETSDDDDDMPLPPPPSVTRTKSKIRKMYTRPELMIEDEV